MGEWMKTGSSGGRGTASAEVMLSRLEPLGLMPSEIIVDGGRCDQRAKGVLMGVDAALDERQRAMRMRAETDESHYQKGLFTNKTRTVS